MLKKIGDFKLIEAVPILINTLLDMESNQLRNTIAVALSDIGCDDESRGTLLYALESFDCSDYGER
ncbi:hypothetical protein [Paenibacillus chitinolyticus]|uniref:hypothetical protein n=1 Tax=Paenibacillus chitinolyticus TaxID=79263 RepID=UPI001C48D8DF|nr:hypothetical protein [Paenibacillus chitinolyticus]